MIQSNPIPLAKRSKWSIQSLLLVLLTGVILLFHCQKSTEAPVSNTQEKRTPAAKEAPEGYYDVQVEKKAYRKKEIKKQVAHSGVLKAINEEEEETLWHAEESAKLSNIDNSKFSDHEGEFLYSLSDGDSAQNDIEEYIPATSSTHMPVKGELGGLKSVNTTMEAFDGAETKGTRGRGSRGSGSIVENSDDSDDIVTLGGLYETDLSGSDSYGLGLSGSGLGGGGVGEHSLGIGTIGTKGKGGRGSGSGYGKGSSSLGERTGKVPKVVPGRPKVTGALDKKTISRVIRRHRNEIKYCYEKELKNNKNLEGKIVIQFTIDGTGTVRVASTRESTLNNKQVEACINAKIKHWMFPAPKGGGIVNVNFPFVFKPGHTSPNTQQKQPTPEPPKKRPTPPKPSEATVFFQQRNIVTGLTFKTARGYWANTYLPGDSLVRTLQQRLTTNQNFSMGTNTPSGLELATRSGTYKQPFDSPPRAALSVFMQADKKKVDKPSRVLLQVGIQGTPRKSGQRSAMNIAVVIDIQTALTKTEKENLKALLEELSKSNEVGDRFSLFVSGMPGGMIIPPGSFKYGPITVALQSLFSDDIRGKRNKRVKQLSLTDAYLKAIETVAASDDPTAPLGSSLVILVTPDRLPGIVPQLSQIAHTSAINGIPTSLIGISSKVDLDQLDKIAISGQGNRRLLLAPNQAEEVIQAELSAASRVVARAVRLRIRLAPGVKLVDVLGSKSLDEVSSQKVRDAEKSIDRRLSINLGIDSDRGEDEDGIQIVIPSFYADDSHVILLDLVVPGAGPVADLTVRYKDLVHLKNGISRANMSLQRGESKMGPLEQNVIKNLLAYELSSILKQSGRLTAGNNYREAYERLNKFVELLKNLKQEIKGFSTDPELESDLELVMSYLLALDSARRGNLARTEDLSDSLFYAGHLKLLGPR